MTTINTPSYTLVNTKIDCGVTWSSTVNYATAYYPGTIRVKSVEQINEEFVNNILKSSTLFDPVRLNEEYGNSRDSTPSPGRLYIDESEDREEIVQQINEEFADGTLNSSTIYYPGRIRVKTVEQINEEFVNNTLKSLTLLNPVPLYEENDYSRDSTPSPGRLYIDESEDRVETLEQINEEFANGILNSSTVNYPGRIRVKTVEQINEEFVNNTLKSSTLLDSVPQYEDYGNSRDSTPSPGRLCIDESEDREETEQQIDKEFANGAPNSPTVYDPVALTSEEYVDSRDSTPSPGRLYIDESEHSENFEMNNDYMDESNVTRSSPAAPLCPINEPTSLVDVKTIKKAYERYFPHHPKPKLRRQRLNAYRDTKEMDLDQLKEDSDYIN